jgi:hypothetical protein
MRIATLAIVLYLGLDFSNPFIAGAFTFNADDSTEAAANMWTLDDLVTFAPPALHGMVMSQAEDAALHAAPEGSTAVAAHRPSEAWRPASHPRPLDRPSSPADH